MDLGLVTKIIPAMHPGSEIIACHLYGMPSLLFQAKFNFKDYHCNYDEGTL